MTVSGLQGAARSVAEALGGPNRTLLFCPQLLPSRHHPPMGFPWLFLPWAVNSMLAWGCGRLFDAALGPTVNRGRRKLGLAPIADMTTHFLTDRPIVTSDALLGPIPPDAPELTIQTGALRLPEVGRLEPGLENFLAEGDPPIFIGFGSMSDGDPHRTTRSLVDALAACGRRGVIHSGWAGLGEGHLPGNVLVVRSVPHALLFPRIALAIHHGGAGTTAAVARAGIPQIVVPHIADQHYWARQVWRLGLGSRPIPRSALNQERLSRAIRSVLSDPEYRLRALAIGATLARTDGVSTVAEILQEAVSDREQRIAA